MRHEILCLDQDTLNDCLIDVPAFHAVRDESISTSLIAGIYALMDVEWKGMDDNEAWAS